MTTMFRALPICLAVLACTSVSVLAQESPPVANEHYPALRHETVVRFFNLKGKLEVGDLNTALREASFELAYGPRTTASRPNNTVVAVSVPADLKSKDVERVLRKARVKSEALEVFLFDGRVENGFPSFGLDLTKLDYMLGMSGDIRWCDMFEGKTVFYTLAGKLDAAKIEDLWRKLQKPLGTEDATLGEVVSERFTWKLPESIDERRAKKLAKAIEKLEGVAAARIAGDALEVTAEFAELSMYGPVRGFDGAALTTTAPPRGTVCTNALWDLLVKEELTPVGN